MKYWALKTRRDKDGAQKKLEEHWGDFLKNNVIAIGWGDINISPPNIPERDEIIEALKNAGYNNYQISRVAPVIDDFLHLTKYDNILICKGYTYNQKKDVRLYGTAKVKDGSWEKKQIGEGEKNWKCFTRKANIVDFNKKDGKDIPIDTLKGFLGEDKFFIGTLIPISEAQYKSIVEWAEEDC